MDVSGMAALSRCAGETTVHTATLANKLHVSVEGANKLDLLESLLTEFISLDHDFRAYADASGVKLPVLWRQGLGPAIEMLLPLSARRIRPDPPQANDMSIETRRRQTT